MAHREEGQNLERIFTLAEANRLIPQLEENLTAVKRAKAVLIRTKDEIKKASAKAQFGGGSYAGSHYITALEQISENLQAIQEMGVLVKDLDIGLCDFPYLMNGRIVHLCWKLGETEIRWWHELNSGYTGRQPLENEQA
ncbi:MAG: DUF2203 domain-containing protein [Nitrospirae bacterium]|nr:DUF2203 domain-containing protein [Nitrospirota bacterium]